MNLQAKLYLNCEVEHRICDIMISNAHSNNTLQISASYGSRKLTKLEPHQQQIQHLQGDQQYDATLWNVAALSWHKELTSFLISNVVDNSLVKEASKPELSTSLHASVTAENINQPPIQYILLKGQLYSFCQQRHHNDVNKHRMLLLM